MECAYACNEVAINWNAPAAFLAGAIEAIYSDTSFHVQRYKHDSIASSADSITIAGLAADRVTILWSTGQSVSASVEYDIDSSLVNARALFSPGTTKHTVTLTGLAAATKYYFRLVSVDDFDSVIMGPIQTFTTKASALMNGFSFDPSTLTMAPGTDLTVAFKGQSGLIVYARFSVGGSAQVTPLTCNENSGTYTATIPGSNITASGILVSIALKSSTDSIVTPVYALAASAPVQISDTLRFAKTYYMLSFPLLQTISRPLDWLGAQLGDTSTWRYYGYNSQTGKYVVDDTIRGGLGKWLYAGIKKTLSVRALAPKPDTLFAISLSQGWNLIGNPFAFPVFWKNSLVRYNGNIVRLYDNAAGQLVRRQWFHYVDTTEDGINDGQYVSNRDVLLADTTRLLPWNGYWVYAEKNGVELLLNPTPAQPQQSSLAKKKLQPPLQWNIRLTASSGKAIDNSTVIGELQDASDAYDQFDSPKPPQLSNDLSAGILHRTWPGGGKALFAADIAHYAENSTYEWQVSIAAAPGKSAVDLSWKIFGNVNGILVLSDSVSGAKVNMSTSNSYSLSLTQGEQQRLLKVKLFPRTGSIFQSTPLLWTLQQTAPNPFKASTKIRFSVPASKAGAIGLNQVIISVFDIMGRRVKNLVNDDRYPGNYTVVWNGTDDAHKRLRQGIYIVHLSANGFSGSVKTHLVD
jgi:hypothetical protein